VRVEITQAGSDRLSALASVLGRAFVVEPMMRWPLGGCVDVEERLIRCSEYFIEDLIQVGTVWEAGEAKGALVWIPPDRTDALEEAQLAPRRVYALSEDGGAPV
jgi:hypothetical protein